MKKRSPEERALRSARKTFEFWYLVLLETEHMNALDYRLKFQSALHTIKDLEKQKKKEA